MVGLAGDGVKCVPLLGGEAKRDTSGRLGMEPLAPFLNDQHLPAICFGADGEAIARELKTAGGDGVIFAVVDSLEAAVEMAAALGRREFEFQGKRFP